MKTAYVPSLKVLFMTIFNLLCVIYIEYMWWTLFMIDTISSLFRGTFVADYTLGGIIILFLDLVVFLLIPAVIIITPLCWSYGCRPIKICGDTVSTGLFPKVYMKREEIDCVGVAAVHGAFSEYTPDNNRGIYLICGDTGKQAVERYGIFFVWAVFAANKRSPEFARKLLRLEAKLNHTPPMEITPADKFLWLSYSHKRYGEILKWLQS